PAGQHDLVLGGERPAQLAGPDAGSRHPGPDGVVGNHQHPRHAERGYRPQCRGSRLATAAAASYAVSVRAATESGRSQATAAGPLDPNPGSTLVSASARATTSPGATSRPVTPSSTMSVSPPTRLATTARPAAPASAATMPKPSRRLGTATNRAAW